MTVNSLKWAMMQAIQQEYEHNVTQQVYVSESLWTILRMAREHMMTILDATAHTMDKTATADQYIQALFEYLEKQEIDPLITALSAIKKEAALRF